MILEGVAIEEDAYQKASELWQHPEIDCIQMEMIWQQALCRLMKKLENSFPSSWGKKTCWLDGSWVSLPQTTKSYQLGHESFKQVLSEEKKTIVIKSEFIQR